MAAELVFWSEGRRVSRALDKDEITIGRDPRNDLVVHNASVSRRHAVVYRDGGDWRVRDLGSKCGTRVNGAGTSAARLRNGDTLAVGQLSFTFSDPDGPMLTGTLAVDPGLEQPVHGFHDAVDFTQLASGLPDVVRMQKVLHVVSQSSHALMTSRTLDEMFERVLDLVFRFLPVERGFVVLWDATRGDFVTRCVKHASTDQGDDVRFSRTIAEKVCRGKVGVLTMDAQEDRRFAEGASILELGIRSAMAAPIWNKDQVDGLIYADTSLQKKAFDKSDLDLLSALGNHLSVAIEQSRLHESIVEEQLVRRRLERYHSPSVIERITSSSATSAGDSLMADERTVTVMFADVVGFSSKCETMDPRDVAELLNQYFSAMTDMVFRHDGTLDKFIGDCMMAVFGAPLESDDHATRAAEAALDMRDALAELNQELPESDRLEFRVGMHSGRVVAGDIGSIRRSDYTVLGATVNTAARIESTVARPGQIVVSNELATLLGDAYETEPLGDHQLRGISRAVKCFRLVGRSPRTGSPRA